MGLIESALFHAFHVFDVLFGARKGGSLNPGLKPFSFKGLGTQKSP